MCNVVLEHFEKRRHLGGTLNNLHVKQSAKSTHGHGRRTLAALAALGGLQNDDRRPLQQPAAALHQCVPTEVHEEDELVVAVLGKLGKEGSLALACALLGFG